MNPALIVAGLVGLLILKRSRTEPVSETASVSYRGRRREPLTGEDRRALARAQELSQEFHGNERHVLELTPRERKLPRFVADAGALEEFQYNPPADSQRDANNAVYSHESGDRGVLRPKSKQKPRLAVDPETRRPVIVPERSPMRFDGRRGFVG